MANQIIIGNIRGKDGEKGNTGATPNIAVAIKNLPAGSSPSVTRSGTNENPLLTFNLPSLNQGTVVVFNVNSTKTNVSTSADFATILSLTKSKQNVRFFAQLQNGDFWELNYFCSASNYLTFGFNNGDYAMNFRWDNNGISNFKYYENTMAFWTYESTRTI